MEPNDEWWLSQCFLRDNVCEALTFGLKTGTPRTKTEQSITVGHIIRVFLN